MKRRTVASMTSMLVTAFSSVAVVLGCSGLHEPGAEEVETAEQALSWYGDLRRDVPGDIRDAYVWSAYPGHDTATLVEQSIGISQGGTQYGLLKADLRAIPVGATIDSASLTALFSASAPHVVRARRITASWTETTVTWSSFGRAYDPTVESSAVADG